MAYVPPQTMEFSEYNPDIEVERCFEMEDINEVPPVYDRFWVNSDGTIEELKDYEIEVKADCSHVYQNGKYSEHKKNSSGGCTITYWEAKKCIKCGFVKINDVINVVTYQKCVH